MNKKPTMKIPTRLLRLGDVQRRVGLSRSSVYALAAKDQFPKPIKLGLRASAWLENEIDDWIAMRIEASRQNGQ